MTERSERNHQRDEIGENAFANAFSEELHVTAMVFGHLDDYDQDTRLWTALQFGRLLHQIMDAKVDPSAVIQKASEIWQKNHPLAGDHKGILTDPVPDVAGRDI